MEGLHRLESLHIARRQAAAAGQRLSEDLVAAHPVVHALHPPYALRGPRAELAVHDPAE